jgi:hypothetical protein
MDEAGLNKEAAEMIRFYKLNSAAKEQSELKQSILNFLQRNDIADPDRTSLFLKIEPTLDQETFEIFMLALRTRVAEVDEHPEVIAFIQKTEDEIKLYDALLHPENRHSKAIVNAKVNELLMSSDRKSQIRGNEIRDQFGYNERMLKVLNEAKLKYAESENKV